MNQKNSSLSSGRSGNCVCLKCGFTSVKKRGMPCMEEKCPNCGAVLLREGGYHYQKAAAKVAGRSNSG